MSSINTEVAGIKMKNPTMLASGIMDETGASMRRIVEAGAGAVVTKSIGIAARPGYPGPIVVELQDGYINAMGLPGPGIDAYGEEIEEAKKGGVPVIGSLFAATPETFSLLAGRMEDFGADGIELNLSCPHAKGYGMEIGVDPKAVGAIVREVKSAVNIPVLSKLTPNTDQLCKVATEVECEGGDAIVAINTLKAMAISVELRRPVLSNGIGGLSGPACKPVGLRCVYELYRTVHIPIIGVGGIETPRDALEYIMAGASAIQIGSGVGRVGPQVFKEVSKGIEEYLDENRMKALRDIVGVAHAL